MKLTARRQGGSTFEVRRLLREGAPVVEKRLHRSLLGQPSALEAIRREAGFLSVARHPAVPQLFEVDLQAEVPFIVEQAFVGPTLTELREIWGDQLPRHLALHLIGELARTIDELHRADDALGALGLVHGDLSPDNVILRSHGTIGLVDFAAARWRGAPPSGPTSTGTLPYAAPEVLRGELESDPSSDRYSVAAIAVLLLGGGPLRPEEELGALLLMAGEEGVDPAALVRARAPEQVRRALEGLLQVDRDRRPDSLDELLRALDSVSMDAQPGL